MILTEKDPEAVRETGYECNVCHKKVIYDLYFLPRRNTIKWTFPNGFGSATDEAHVCSVPCLVKYLQGIYFGAEVYYHLSF